MSSKKIPSPHAGAKEEGMRQQLYYPSSNDDSNRFAEVVETAAAVVHLKNTPRPKNGPRHNTNENVIQQMQLQKRDDSPILCCGGGDNDSFIKTSATTRSETVVEVQMQRDRHAPAVKPTLSRNSTTKKKRKNNTRKKSLPPSSSSFPSSSSAAAGEAKQPATIPTATSTSTITTTRMEVPASTTTFSSAKKKKNPRKKKFSPPPAPATVPTTPEPKPVHAPPTTASKNDKKATTRKTKKKQIPLVATNQLKEPPPSSLPSVPNTTNDNDCLVLPPPACVETTHATTVLADTNTTSEQLSSLLRQQQQQQQNSIPPYHQQHFHHYPQHQLPPHHLLLRQLQDQQRAQRQQQEQQISQYRSPAVPPTTVPDRLDIIRRQQQQQLGYHHQQQQQQQQHLEHQQQQAAVRAMMMSMLPPQSPIRTPTTSPPSPSHNSTVYQQHDMQQPQQQILLQQQQSQSSVPAGIMEIQQYHPQHLQLPSSILRSKQQVGKQLQTNFETSENATNAGDDDGQKSVQQKSLSGVPAEVPQNQEVSIIPTAASISPSSETTPPQNQQMRDQTTILSSSYSKEKVSNATEKGNYLDAGSIQNHDRKLPAKKKGSNPVEKAKDSLSPILKNLDRKLPAKHKKPPPPKKKRTTNIKTRSSTSVGAAVASINAKKSTGSRSMKTQRSKKLPTTSVGMTNQAKTTKATIIGVKSTVEEAKGTVTKFPSNSGLLPKTKKKERRLAEDATAKSSLEFGNKVDGTGMVLPPTVALESPASPSPSSNGKQQLLHEVSPSLAESPRPGELSVRQMSTEHSIMEQTQKLAEGTTADDTRVGTNSTDRAQISIDCDFKTLNVRLSQKEIKAIEKDYDENLKNRGMHDSPLYQRRPGKEGIHDGQYLVDCKQNRFLVLDFSIVPTDADREYAQRKSPTDICIPDGAGVNLCKKKECSKIGVPVLLYDSSPDMGPALSGYFTKAHCITCWKEHMRSRSIKGAEARKLKKQEGQRQRSTTHATSTSSPRRSSLDSKQRRRCSDEAATTNEKSQNSSAVEHGLDKVVKDIIENRLGPNGGEIFQLRPGKEGIDDGQYLVHYENSGRSQCDRVVVVDYSMVPEELDMDHAQDRKLHSTSRGDSKRRSCRKISCNKNGAPVLLYDTHPKKKCGYVTGGWCFTCYRDIAQKKSIANRARRKEKNLKTPTETDPATTNPTANHGNSTTKANTLGHTPIAGVVADLGSPAIRCKEKSAKDPNPAEATAANHGRSDGEMAELHSTPAPKDADLNSPGIIFEEDSAKKHNLVETTTAVNPGRCNEEISVLHSTPAPSDADLDSNEIRCQESSAKNLRPSNESRPVLTSVTNPGNSNSGNNNLGSASLDDDISAPIVNDLDCSVIRYEENTKVEVEGTVETSSDASASGEESEDESDTGVSEGERDSESEEESDDEEEQEEEEEDGASWGGATPHATSQQQDQEETWYGVEPDYKYEQLLDMCTSLTRTFTELDVIDTIPGVELPDPYDNFENISNLLVKYGDWQRVQDTNPGGGFLYYPPDTQLVVLDEPQFRLYLERQCAWENNEQHDNDIAMQASSQIKHVQYEYEDSDSDEEDSVSNSVEDEEDTVSNSDDDSESESTEDDDESSACSSVSQASSSVSSQQTSHISKTSVSSSMDEVDRLVLKYFMCSGPEDRFTDYCRQHVEILGDSVGVKESKNYRRYNRAKNRHIHYMRKSKKYRMSLAEERLNDDPDYFDAEVWNNEMQAAWKVGNPCTSSKLQVLKTGCKAEERKNCNCCLRCKSPPWCQTTYAHGDRNEIQWTDAAKTDWKKRHPCTGVMGQVLQWRHKQKYCENCNSCSVCQSPPWCETDWAHERSKKNQQRGTVQKSFKTSSSRAKSSSSGEEEEGGKASNTCSPSGESSSSNQDDGNGDDKVDRLILKYIASGSSDLCNFADWCRKHTEVLGNPSLNSQNPAYKKYKRSAWRYSCMKKEAQRNDFEDEVTQRERLVLEYLAGGSAEVDTFADWCRQHRRVLGDSLTDYGSTEYDRYSKSRSMLRKFKRKGQNYYLPLIQQIQQDNPKYSETTGKRILNRERRNQSPAGKLFQHQTMQRTKLIRTSRGRAVLPVKDEYDVSMASFAVTNAARRKYDDNDNFYTFRNLISFNRACLKWLYVRTGERLHTYKYVIGDKAGPYGEAGVDFLYEESDVVEYCKKHNYKTRYAKEFQRWTKNGRANAKMAAIDSVKDWIGETPSRNADKSKSSRNKPSERVNHDRVEETIDTHMATHEYSIKNPGKQQEQIMTAGAATSERPPTTSERKPQAVVVVPNKSKGASIGEVFVEDERGDTINRKRHAPSEPIVPVTDHSTKPRGAAQKTATENSCAEADTTDALAIEDSSPTVHDVSPSVSNAAHNDIDANFAGKNSILATPLPGKATIKATAKSSPHLKSEEKTSVRRSTRSSVPVNRPFLISTPPFVTNCGTAKKDQSKKSQNEPTRQPSPASRLLRSTPLPATNPAAATIARANSPGKILRKAPKAAEEARAPAVADPDTTRANSLGKILRGTSSASKNLSKFEAAAVTSVLEKANSPDRTLRSTPHTSKRLLGSEASLNIALRSTSHTAKTPSESETPAVAAIMEKANRPGRVLRSTHSASQAPVEAVTAKRNSPGRLLRSATADAKKLGLGHTPALHVHTNNNDTRLDSRHDGLEGNDTTESMHAVQRSSTSNPDFVDQSRKSWTDEAKDDWKMKNPCIGAAGQALKKGHKQRKCNVCGFCCICGSPPWCRNEVAHGMSLSRLDNTSGRNQKQKRESPKPMKQSGLALESQTTTLDLHCNLSAALADGVDCTADSPNSVHDLPTFRVPAVGVVTAAATTTAPQMTDDDAAQVEELLQSLPDVGAETTKVSREEPAKALRKTLKDGNEGCNSILIAQPSRKDDEVEVTQKLLQSTASTSVAEQCRKSSALVEVDGSSVQRDHGSRSTTLESSENEETTIDSATPLGSVAQTPRKNEKDEVFSDLPKKEEQTSTSHALAQDEQPARSQPPEQERNFLPPSQNKTTEGGEAAKKGAIPLISGGTINDDKNATTKDKNQDETETGTQKNPPETLLRCQAHQDAEDTHDPMTASKLQSRSLQASSEVERKAEKRISAASLSPHVRGNTKKEQIDTKRNPSSNLSQRRRTNQSNNPVRKSRRKILPVKDVYNLSMAAYAVTNVAIQRKKENHDDFYTFVNLMAFNQACLNWRYMSGGEFYSYKYVIGDQAGACGQAGIDFFHEENEVVEYCRKNDYKNKYANRYKEWIEAGKPKTCVSSKRDCAKASERTTKRQDSLIAPEASLPATKNPTSSKSALPSIAGSSIPGNRVTAPTEQSVARKAARGAPVGTTCNLSYAAKEDEFASANNESVQKCPGKLKLIVWTEETKNQWKMQNPCLGIKGQPLKGGRHRMKRCQDCNCCSICKTPPWCKTASAHKGNQKCQTALSASTTQVQNDSTLNKAKSSSCKKKPPAQSNTTKESARKIKKWPSEGPGEENSTSCSMTQGKKTSTTSAEQAGECLNAGYPLMPDLPVLPSKKAVDRQAKQNASSKPTRGQSGKATSVYEKRHGKLTSTSQSSFQKEGELLLRANRKGRKFIEKKEALSRIAKNRSANEQQRRIPTRNLKRKMNEGATHSSKKTKKVLPVSPTNSKKITRLKYSALSSSTSESNKPKPATKEPPTAVMNKALPNAANCGPAEDAKKAYAVSPSSRKIPTRLQQSISPSNISVPNTRYSASVDEKYVNAENRIENPHPNDVVLGPVKNHSGNNKLLEWVDDHATEYKLTPTGKKIAVVHKILEKVRNQNPPGKFLKPANNDDDEEEEVWWVEVTVNQAMDKIYKCFRKNAKTKTSTASCDETPSLAKEQLKISKQRRKSLPVSSRKINSKKRKAAKTESLPSNSESGKRQRKDQRSSQTALPEPSRNPLPRRTAASEASSNTEDRNNSKTAISAESSRPVTAAEHNMKKSPPGLSQPARRSLPARSSRGKSMHSYIENAKNFKTTTSSESSTQTAAIELNMNQPKPLLSQPIQRNRPVRSSRRRSIHSYVENGNRNEDGDKDRSLGSMVSYAMTNVYRERTKPDFDPFYTFDNLMAFNRARLNWLYLQTSGKSLYNYQYVVGDKAGPEGELGVDFFHEESEVVEYCRKNDYKTLYATEYEQWLNGGRPSSKGYDSMKDWSASKPRNKH